MEKYNEIGHLATFDRPIKVNVLCEKHWYLGTAVKRLYNVQRLAYLLATEVINLYPFISLNPIIAHFLWTRDKIGL